MSARNAKDVPGVVTAPPLIYLAPLLVGILRDRQRTTVQPKAVTRVLGLSLSGTGLAIGLQASWRFRRAHTPLEPWQPTTALVTAGIYRRTRNPIYLAFALTYAGAALLASSRTALGLLPAVVVVVNRGVISREERYLEQKFGEEYRAYCRRVRRWI